MGICVIRIKILKTFSKKSHLFNYQVSEALKEEKRLWLMIKEAFEVVASLAILSSTFVQLYEVCGLDP